MRELTAPQAWRKIGPDLVTLVRDSYEKWKENPNPKTKQAYLKWRLRIHLRANHERELLELVNEAYNLGLYDEEAGDLYWDVTRG